MRRASTLYRLALGITASIIGVGTGAMLVGGTALPAAADPLCLDVLGVRLCPGQPDPPPTGPVDQPTPPPSQEVPAPAEEVPTPSDEVVTRPDEVPATTGPATPGPARASGQVPLGPPVVTTTNDHSPGPLATLPSTAPTQAPAPAPSPTATRTPAPSHTPVAAAPMADPLDGAEPAAAVGPLTLSGVTLLLVGALGLAALLVARSRGFGTRQPGRHLTSGPAAPGFSGPG